MKKYLRFLSVLLIAAIFSSAAQSRAVGAFAQKAEPKEIKFAKGKSSATVTGKLKTDQQAEYVIYGREGQTLTLTFSSTVGKRAEVFVFSPATSGEAVSGNKTWEVGFDSEGKLEIQITCSRGCGYTLKTTIK